MMGMVGLNWWGRDAVDVQWCESGVRETRNQGRGYLVCVCLWWVVNGRRGAYTYVVIIGNPQAETDEAR